MEWLILATWAGPRRPCRKDSLSGRLLLPEEPEEAGSPLGTLLWNAQSDQGLAVPNGTYLVEVTAKAAEGAQARRSHR